MNVYLVAYTLVFGPGVSNEKQLIVVASTPANAVAAAQAAEANGTVNANDVQELHANVTVGS